MPSPSLRHHPQPPAHVTKAERAIRYSSRCAASPRSGVHAHLHEPVTEVAEVVLREHALDVHLPSTPLRLRRARGAVDLRSDRTRQQTHERGSEADQTMAQAGVTESAAAADRVRALGLAGRCACGCNGTGMQSRFAWEAE